jgi:CheY-like chemotaxis protein
LSIPIASDDIINHTCSVDVRNQAQGSARSILIVDDDALILGIGCRAIRQIGFEVYSAGNMLGALNYLTSNKSIGLVISDVQMPQGSGLDLYDRMKMDKRWSAIPFALMTGGSLSNLPGGVFVLPKPFRPLQNCCVVIAHLGGQCPAPSPQGAMILGRVHSSLGLETADGNGRQASCCRLASCDTFLRAAIA